jgi:hypothetical protein
MGAASDVAGQSPEAAPTRRQWQAVIGALVVALAFDHAFIVPYLRTAAFHMDVWEMIARAYDPRGLWQSQLDEMAHWIRIRPLFQMAVPLWVRWRGLDGPGLAMVLWGLVLVWHLLVYRFLREVGYRRETAVLATFAVLTSCGVINTCYAHQYNDLMFANFFVLAALIVALRWPGAGSLALTIPLLFLGLMSHECAVMTGPLLLLADAQKEGISQAIRRALTPSRVVLLVLCVGYGVLRVLKTPATESSLMGSHAVLNNLPPLLSAAASFLLKDFRGPFLIIVAYLAWEQLKANFEPTRLLLALAWLVVAYVPFLTNQKYQSNTYLNLALIGPAAAVLDPVARWVFSPQRTPRWQIALPALTVLALNHWGLRDDLRAYGRFTGPALDAVTSHVAPDQKRVDVWLIETPRGGQLWGRTMLQDALDLYRLDESVAFNMLLPARTVRVHTMDPELFRFARPRPNDVVLEMLDQRDDHASLWRLPANAAPELLHQAGSAPDHPAPVEWATLPPEALDFWESYRVGIDPQVALEQVEAGLDTATKRTPPPWLRALRAMHPTPPAPPVGMPASPLPLTRDG